MEPNQNSLSRTITNYGKRLFGFIRKRVDNTEDAEDILQDVWYQLSRIVDLEEIENVGAWLFRVARNRITDLYRRQEPLSLDDIELKGDGGDFRLHELLLDNTTSEDPTLRELFWSVFQESIDNLPENQRVVFVQNEIDGLTLQEIADDQEVSLKTIISRKRYAVKRLRESMQSFYDELNS